MKQCKTCGERKALDDFYKCAAARDGREGTCKACRVARDADWQRQNPDRVATKVGRWRKSNPDRVSGYNKKFRQERPEVAADNAARYKERHPEKASASRRVREAVERGHLEKPDCCEDCGGEFPPDRLDGHHDDYSRPLEVRWLCRQCHVDRHAATA